MSPRAAVVWTPQFLSYELSDDHPLDPVRLDLTMRLAGELGVLEGVEHVVPEPAPDTEIQRIHVPSYLTAVKSAPELPFGIGHGLGTDDNPIFPGMHEAGALIAGGSIAGGPGDRARRGRPGGQLLRRPAPCDGRPRLRLLRLQRLRAGASRRCSTPASAGSPTSTSTPTTATGCRRRSTTTRGCSRSRCTSPRCRCSRAPAGPGRVRRRGGRRAPRSTCALPAGTSIAAWLRAFHAVVPGLLTAFRPEVLVTQHGADTHREDPLADLKLSVDGQRDVYLALRDLAETVTGGRWLALGGGGYSPVRVVPRAWTHLLAIVPDRDVPGHPDPGGLDRARRHARPRAADIDMTDGAAPRTGRGGRCRGTRRLAVQDTRRAVFPLHGLDPQIRVTDYRDTSPQPPTRRRRTGSDPAIPRTGRPTSLRPTAASCTCARSARPTPSAPRRCTPVCARALVPAVLLASAHLASRSRCSPSSTTTPGWRSSPPGRRDHRGRPRTTGIRAGGNVDAAEVAFSPEDTQQRRGLGSILLEHLAAAAQERGIRRFDRRGAHARTRRWSGCSWTPGTRSAGSTTRASSTWNSTSTRRKVARGA